MEKSKVQRRLIDIISNLNESISNTPRQARRRFELIKSRDEVQALLDDLNDDKVDFNSSKIRLTLWKLTKFLFTWASGDYD